MVISSRNSRDTLNDLLRYCREGDIIIDHGNSILKTLDAEQNGYLNLASRILTAVLVVGYGLERGFCLMVGGGDTAVSTCTPIFNALAPGIDAAPHSAVTFSDNLIRMVALRWSWCWSLCKDGS